MRVQCNLRDDIYLQFVVFKLSMTEVLVEISDPQSTNNKTPSSCTIQDEISPKSNNSQSSNDKRLIK